MGKNKISWEVLLCNFKDATIPSEPTLQKINSLFLPSRNSTENLVQYWKDVSFGKVEIENCMVHNWIQSDRRHADFNPKIERDGIINGIHDWGLLATWAKEAAEANNISLSEDKYKIIIWNIPNPEEKWNQPNESAEKGAVPFQSIAKDVGNYLISYLHRGLHLNLFSHETAHVLGMPHSWDDQIDSQNPRSAEYKNPWDVVGGKKRKYEQQDRSNFRFNKDKFGRDFVFLEGGPGVSAYHLNNAGWLEEKEVMNIDIEDDFSRKQIEIFPCNLKGNHAKTKLVIINDGCVGDGKYYIEFRVKEGWDRSIPNNGLLINKYDINVGSIRIQTSDIETFRTDWKVGASYNKSSNFFIDVEAVNQRCSIFSIIKRKNYQLLDYSYPRRFSSVNFSHYEVNNNLFVKISGIAKINLSVDDNNVWKSQIIDVKVKVPQHIHRNTFNKLISHAPSFGLSSVHTMNTSNNVGHAIDYFYLKEYNKDQRYIIFRCSIAARGNHTHFYSMNFMLNLLFQKNL